MSNGSHQLYLTFCGCGRDLFTLKSTLSVGMGVTMGCCLLVLALDICVGIGCVIVGCHYWVWVLGVGCGSWVLGVGVGCGSPNTQCQH